MYSKFHQETRNGIRGIQPVTTQLSRQATPLRRLGTSACTAAVFSLALQGQPAVHAQSPQPRDTRRAERRGVLDDPLLPPRDVKGHKVGPSSCQMIESALSYDGKAYKRIRFGLDGTVDGYAAKVGDYKDYFTNGPDLVFPQTWGPRPVLFGVAKYERAKGAAMVIVYPADKAGWNGKMFVTVHGRGTSFKEGQLKAWDKNLDTANPIRDLDKYERLMVSKGYIVVKTRRTSTEGIGEITATLEDGSTVDSIAFNDTTHYIMDFADVAKAAMAKRLARRPMSTCTATRPAPVSATASTTRRASTSAATANAISTRCSTTTRRPAPGIRS